MLVHRREIEQPEQGRDSEVQDNFGKPEVAFYYYILVSGLMVMWRVSI